ncbi:EamA family transporter, partial [Listeria monocytogenes]
WSSAGCLVVYAVGFAAAYLTLGAATGALALFAAVQITIQVTAWVRGERPGRRAWAGFALATIGFIALALPGANAPDRIGLALMVAAGAAWGA